MEAWRPYYEQELALLRQHCHRFAAEHPRLAAALALTAEGGADTGLEWLLQASAFLNARLVQRLDASQDGFAAALLEQQQAHYLRSLPSGAIAQFDWSGLEPGSLSTVSTVARGSELKALQGGAAGACRLRTVQDVHIAPLRVGDLRFQPVFDAPAALRLPPDAHSAISLRLDSLASTPEAMPQGLPMLRLFPDGAADLRAALRDSLLLQTVACYVECEGRWQRLEQNPLTPVMPEAAHLPPAPGDDPACRLLSEYFAYPESFDFCDLDLAAVAAAAGQPVGHSLQVHWVLRDLRQRPTLRLLHQLESRHLRLGCTPVINLFAAEAEPLGLASGEISAPLRPSRTRLESCELYCVERVGLLHKGGGAPATVFQDACAPHAAGPYWQLQREDAMLAAVEGHAFRLALLDGDRRPLVLAGETLSVQLSCSNGALASTLRPGQAAGDLSSEAGSGIPIRLLRRPSTARPAALDPSAYREAIAGLAPRPSLLGREGWPALLSLLRCHVATDDVQGQRLLAGLGDLETQPATLWRNGQPWHGRALYLCVDEEVFAERSLHSFALVLNRFLARYIHTHSFVRLHLLAQASGAELLRCPPCAGSLPLV
ncbi:type VI secretion system baseplate subunit TssF [Massilia sp. BJB1822]|uniref:type VI secretion system baseplate subunit TssF n=1 Tax=Massilia sp. BJB1822 TaxID=2744470 RepID=UPI001592D4C5|nr:type VI secretion system baseplate subunit TssF [Massilia sp. BJB1822]NVD96432.1 type VI secretion system baseplate subunit TssF [Massilia sp. BJB1822]